MSLLAILSFSSLQLGWCACVMGAAAGHPWIGPFVVSTALAAHVRLQPSRERTGEVFVLISAAMIGCVLDTALLRFGVIRLAGAEVSPPWLVALWPNVAVATAANGSLRALARRPIVGALLGAVAGPFAYAAGARLGAIGLDDNRLRSFVVIGAVWCGVIPSFVWLRLRIGSRLLPRGPAPNRPCSVGSASAGTNPEHSNGFDRKQEETPCALRT